MQLPNTKPLLVLWNSWLDAGWHGVSPSDWATDWLPLRLKSELAFLSEMGEANPRYAQVVKREKRNAVDRLIRFQHHLPWTVSGKPPFICESGILKDVAKEKEHAIPVVQLRNYVLLALEKQDFDEAKRRLQFAWLLPTILVSKTTHDQIRGGDNRLCDDFRRPYSRYGKRKVTLFDGSEVIADTYGWGDVVTALKQLPQIGAALESLRKLRFPDEEEIAKTKLGIPRLGRRKK